MPRYRKSNRSESGFTLLEVLVAFVIAALAFSVLFKAAGGGIGAVDTAGRYEEALSRARSHLTAVGRTAQLSASNQSGDDGAGFRWGIAVQRLGQIQPSTDDQTANDQPSPPSPLGLYRVTVTISWSEGGRTRSVELRSQRLSPLPGSANG